MNYYLKGFFLIIFLLITCFTQVLGQWNIVQTPSSENIFSLIHIINSDMIAVGAKGNIIVSNDSGYTWSKQNYNGFENLRSVKFENENKGLICGENALILKTENKGVSWSIKHSLSGKYLNDIEVKNADGLAVGRQGYILESKDSGQSWSQLMSKTTHTFYTLCRLPQHVFLIGADSGYLYNWNPVSQELNNIKLETNLRVNKIQYLDSGIVIATGGNPDTLFTNAAENFMAISLDTGKTWQYSYYEQARQFNKSYFLNKDTGYFAMPSGRIGHTFTGGTTFNAHYIGTLININDIYFFNNNFGICASDVGRIYITKNAGGFALNQPEINKFSKHFLTLSNPITENIIHYNSSVNGKIIILSLDGKHQLTHAIELGKNKVQTNLITGVYSYTFISGTGYYYKQTGILIVQN